MTLAHPRPKLCLAIAVGVCLLAGALGSLATTPKIPTWYTTIAKPAWNPPSWVFGPVWTTLYVLMGIAAWMIWMRRDHAAAPRALAWFGVQLVLNVLWSFLFFGMENPGAAFVELVGLWLAIAITIDAFRRVYVPAAWLLAPYIAWVSFAGALNYTIWRLNQ